MTRPPGDQNPDLVNDPVSVDRKPSDDVRVDAERRRLHRRMFEQPRLEPRLEPRSEPRLDSARSETDSLHRDPRLPPRSERSLRDRTAPSFDVGNTPFGDMALPRADDDLFARSAGAMPADDMIKDEVKPIVTEMSATPVAEAMTAAPTTEAAASPSSLPAADFDLPVATSDAGSEIASVENNDRDTPLVPTAEMAAPNDEPAAPELPAWLKTSREPMRADPSLMPQRPRPSFARDRASPSTTPFIDRDGMHASEPELGSEFSRDLRATRSLMDSPDLDMGARFSDPRIMPDQDVFSDRIEPRFDSASDEAVAFVDPRVPPLVDDRFVGSLRNSRLELAKLKREAEGAAGRPPQSEAPRRTEPLRNMRNVIEDIHGSVDEARVARAEARFKPKVPTEEDLISQSRSDEMDEFETLRYEPELRDPSARKPLLNFKFDFARALNPSKTPKPEQVIAPAQRSQRRKRQSRLYEDIVAWIVVPPFVIGAIYGVMELSKILSNSPLGKILSGQ